jgi:hypothetical protein
VWHDYILAADRFALFRSFCGERPMDPTKLKLAATPKSMGAYLKKTAAASEHSMHSPAIRTTEYHGHEISIETVYRVQIDGKTVKMPLMVDDAGTVHCHSLPNYQFQSALDMVKAIVDVFPNALPKSKKPGSTSGHHAHAAMSAKGTKSSTKNVKGSGKSTKASRKRK